MNTPSPLVPQGTLPSGKSTLRVAVFTILVIHVALIGGFLFQGCSKKESPPVDETVSSETNNPEALTNNDIVPPLDGSNAPVSTVSNTAAPEPAIQPAVAPAYAAPEATASAAPSAIEAPTGNGFEYAVVKGDTLAVIAKRHGVSLKALQEANPGVDPRKLKVKQKLQIPSGPNVLAATSTGGESAGSSEGTIYTVKAGDVLAKIARRHHVSVAAIVALNNLKSKNSIKLGQKLRMPAPKTAAAPAAPAALDTPAAAPMSPLAPATTAPAAPIQ